MRPLSDRLDNDSTLVEELESFYQEVYNFFQTKESILKTLFNIPDIKITKVDDENHIYDMVAEIRDNLVDEFIVGNLTEVTTYTLNYLLTTKDFQRIEDLLKQEGVTLLKGLNLTNTILKENFNLGAIQTTVHIDTDIDIETRKNSAYYLQIQLFKH